MATRIGDSLLAEKAGCPICLEMIASPRQLPCMHAFCEKCLQDYISTKIGTEGETVKEFMCPVCRAVTSQPNTGQSVEEWASDFPRSAISVTAETKKKVDRYCDACRYEGESNNADIFCVVCDEGLCSTCSKVHRKTKSTRDHKLLSIDELTATLENPLRFTEGFSCPDHQEKQIEYYCQIHDAVCCEDCFFINHRSCHNIKRLSIDLPILLQELKPENIVDKMKTIEKHLQTFLEKNEFNMYELEAEVNNLTAEILDMRQRINKKLDELKELVESEGHRIYKENMIKRQEENHRCQDLISAVRNSHAFLETVLKYGTDIQKFLVCKKSLTQFKPYTDQIKEKYEETESVTLHLEAGIHVHAILSQDFSSIAKLESIPLRMHFPYTVISSNPLYSSKLLAERQVNLEKVVEIQSVGKCDPMYSGIVYLPDGCVVLTDFMNKICCLYDASYIFVSSYNLHESPYEVCLLEHNEVAVTYSNKTIQFLSISDRTINGTGTVTTKHRCDGVAAIGRYEIVVSGSLDDLRKCYWSIVSRKHGETCFYAFDYLYTHVTRVALSRNNSRVYISGFGSGEVFCFGLTNGKQHFIYSSKDLKDPYGIAVDREDNVYIVGNRSQNIHKLSPDGTMIQIITAGVPHDPKIISFDKSQERFILTNGSVGESRKLHVFDQK